MISFLPHRRLTLVPALAPALLAAALAAAAPVRAQGVFAGRLRAPRFPGSTERVPLTGAVVFASRDGALSEPLSFRTWETEPAGWFRLSGGPGSYTVLFVQPAGIVRPTLLTNVAVPAVGKVSVEVEPTWDLATFDDRAWDTKPAAEYLQPFVARGRSVTNVGFRLATDGVDGAGPGQQTLLVSVVKDAAGAGAAAWSTLEPLGPELPVLDVDCGGPRSPIFSVGWRSGEVPVEPGTTYAVRLRAASPGGVFQAFWRDAGDGLPACFRRAAGGSALEATGKTPWIAVGTDHGGLVIPYQKRVHRQFHELTHIGKRWTQTYVARGRALASVIVYAAVSGAQPPLSRQRIRVRLLEGGPEGAPVGTPKIAVGNGNYTGDASWGMFGVAFAPGEAPVEPGAKYAIEMESIEGYETLHGFVNIKGQVSDDRPGFNPYKKCPPDDDPQGEAYWGDQRVDYDLDLQVTEYERSPEGWSLALDEESRVVNGGFEEAADEGAQREAGGAGKRTREEAPAEIDASRAAPRGWKLFEVGAGLLDTLVTEPAPGESRFARLEAQKGGPRPAEGGWVQQVAGLRRADAYRLSARVRVSWPQSDEHGIWVGVDPTGQDSDPGAATIQWTALGDLHGVFLPFLGEPIRPEEGSITIWLRARATAQEPFPFKADFDDVALRKVRTEVP